MKFQKPLNYVVGVVLILTCVLLFSSLSGAASNSNASIGVVDMEKIQKDLPDYQKLQSLVKDKDAEFKLFQNYVYVQHQNSLKSLKEKADKEKEGKNSEQQAAIDTKYNEEIQKKTEETRDQLDKKRNELMKTINEQKAVVEEQVKKLIASIAQDKKLSVVLEKGSVLYGGTDITELVIEKGKKEAEKVKTKEK